MNVPETTNLITPERIQLSIRARFNPIPSLTPQLLSAYLESFRVGFFRNIALTWDAMERRDYKIQTVAPKRKKSVARNGWEILTVDDSPAAQQQKLALEYFYNHLTATSALEENETGGLALLIRQMMDAIGKRYAVHEIIWQPAPASAPRDGLAAPQLTAAFRFCPLWWFEGTQGRLRFLPTEFALYGVDLEPGGWLVTVGDGVMEACSVAYMFKHLPLRDWLASCEKFGMPAIVGRTDAAPDSPEWNSFVAAIKEFSTDWSAVFNRTNSIDLIESKTTGEGPFAPLVEKMDRAITALWRGADLGTVSSHNAAGASLQADETDILETDDAQLISETLTTQVSRYVLQYHFGDAPQLAYIKIRSGRKNNVEQELKVDQFLLDSGAPVAISDTLERYHRPIPKPTEPLLKPNISAGTESASTTIKPAAISSLSPRDLAGREPE
jgi:phage gp29-like protein